MTAQTAQEAASQEAASRCTLADVAEGGATAAPGKGQPDGDCRDEARHDDHESVHAFDWIEASRIALVAAAAVAVWFRAWEPFPAVSVIGIAGLLIGGWPILREAFENILARRMTMELSMTIAIVAAAAIGQFFTALVITLFVLVAEVLERLTVGRGRTAIRDLLEFLPDEVSVRRAGAIRAVSAGELSIGEAVLVAPGGRIPVDGAVLSGHSFVDESRITGESMPVEKTAGTPVFAGSINQSGTLEVSAERIGRDTSYGKIIEAVERAERSRAKHVAYDGSLYIFFQPEYTFDICNVNRTKVGLKAQIRERFADAGMSYDGATIDSRRKALSFVFPMESGDPPVRWWEPLEPVDPAKEPAAV